MKLLSICIPTFNRAHFLEQVLASIVDSLTIEIQSQIEIVISNNASTDKTTEIISKYQKKLLDISWNIIHQTTNIGSINVVAVTKYATGKFIWIVSDDDIVSTSSIEYILHVLQEKNNLKSLILEYSTFQENPFANKHTPLKTKVKLFNKNEALSMLSTNITFLSILIFENKNLQIDRAIKNSSHLPQCYLFADQISQGQVGFVSGASIYVRENNSGGYNFFQVFVTQFDDLLQYCSSFGFSKKTIQAVKTKHLWYLYKFSIILKSQNYGTFTLDSNDAIQRMKAAYPNHWIGNIIIMVLKIPDTFLQKSQGIFQKILSAFKS
jgi:glycosyltransferase involved in cell wall biosynthesis